MAYARTQAPAPTRLLEPRRAPLAIKARARSVAVNSGPCTKSLEYSAACRGRAANMRPARRATKRLAPRARARRSKAAGASALTVVVMATAVAMLPGDPKTLPASTSGAAPAKPRMMWSSLE